ncbi:MAG: transposase [Candidatus Omnitrophota bacterium]
MPRSARILLENVCYHIISRGNQKQDIFLECSDYEVYLKLLAKYKVKYRFKLYGYCLMTNHIHLIIEPKAPQELPKIMQGLNQSYTVWFNEKYNKVGHLWQNRFKSMVIQKDEYLLTCINYIEFNPVRSNAAKELFEYRWCSYKARLLGYKNGLLDEPKII